MNSQNAHNVTLGGPSEEGKQYFPCPVCFEMVEIRYAKNAKPYCVCNDCGVQLFVRGKRGIKRFKELIPNCDSKFESKRLINLIDYYEKLEEKLSEIEAKKPFWGENENEVLNIQEKAIKKQLNYLKKKLND